MDQPSRQIADRYQVHLTDAWCQWFDGDADAIALPGEFRVPASAHSLLERSPQCIWPGLMLPDTIPVLSNEYGDWICVRVDEHNCFGELLHWYHGGGDWIPLGRSLAEAVLHDAVDSLRIRTSQVLRGATESQSLCRKQDFKQRVSQSILHDWLARQLDTRDLHMPVLNAIEQEEYLIALSLLLESGWATCAVLCDRMEIALQYPANSMANPSIAHRLGINWEPDFVRWLFDLSTIPQDAFQQIQEILHSSGLAATGWQQQDWNTAESLAHQVLNERWDLGWAVDIAGWAAQRRGDLLTAANIYFRGRHASAFSNQSVRMRTHWFDQQFGKFSLSQLWMVRDHLNVSDREDSYVQEVWQTPSRLLQRHVQDYWSAAGRELMRHGNFTDAYHAFYRAGWDLGAQRMTEYLDVLENLVQAAEAAGWKARSAVAATHLASLSKMLPK
jgi:hypothetical protein